MMVKKKKKKVSQSEATGHTIRGAQRCRLFSAELHGT